ncbi:hypothetical protein [Streptomyces sp. CL12-4]|uniref:hypothetical protein n=1 Tax=Streptomyces sp. CL12-4 TaxID=2810306 RepID=UPI001EFA4AD4|nr:hypothetical protein [Streptomyces sp. CL12-4]MCG8971820.1 hypothetical protein [Streptomyces sp. CL12-4]
MTTAYLTPVSAFDDAHAKVCAAAREMLTLVSVSLHHQFPTGAYLVLTRPVDHDDEDAVRLDSVRDAQGAMLREFEPWGRTRWPLPALPDALAALWGNRDPRDPRDVLDLIQRVDAVDRYEFLDFLPLELRTAEEIRKEGEGGRTPLGLPLRAAHCPVHGVLCEPDDHVEPPTVYGEVI